MKSVKILASPHKSLNDEVTRTLMNWQFIPGKIKGFPVKVQVIKEIGFSLK